eukprot:CAMPEP_0114385502 /NCGR_PEP_ID=MMETSP0102-20121206/6034_1 /TAXON_ID=38822 ORGANISM="Pteridomonas danica, Strain PT" /NCGR_SAMPLE_ID=MMETSP0102 /ASSEMBLY_ACC=CAM_ASM_000212 /LENGTH=172 /DNA_ID=CAMNT_0001542089 /DNA_START=1 /DNA_END=515 /DNA_ORIENTATION=+
MLFMHHHQLIICDLKYCAGDVMCSLFVLQSVMCSKSLAVWTNFRLKRSGDTIYKKYGGHRYIGVHSYCTKVPIAISVSVTQGFFISDMYVHDKSVTYDVTSSIEVLRQPHLLSAPLKVQQTKMLLKCKKNTTTSSDSFLSQFSSCVYLARTASKVLWLDLDGYGYMKDFMFV